MLREVNLRGAAISDSSLVNLRIDRCELNGATIDGIPLVELINFWKDNHKG